MRYGSPVWQDEQNRRRFFMVRMLYFSGGAAHWSKTIQTLLEYDLVDEFWLKIFPVTLGMGKRLFDKGTIPASYTLVESKSSPCGVIIATFKRAGEVKTGSFA